MLSPVSLSVLANTSTSTSSSTTTNATATATPVVNQPPPHTLPVRVYNSNTLLFNNHPFINPLSLRATRHTSNRSYNSITTTTVATPSTTSTAIHSSSLLYTPQSTRISSAPPSSSSHSLYTPQRQQQSSTAKVQPCDCTNNTSIDYLISLHPLPSHASLSTPSSTSKYTIPIHICQTVAASWDILLNSAVPIPVDGCNGAIHMNSIESDRTNYPFGSKLLHQQAVKNRLNEEFAYRLFYLCPSLQSLLTGSTGHTKVCTQLCSLAHTLCHIQDTHVIDNKISMFLLRYPELTHITEWHFTILVTAVIDAIHEVMVNITCIGNGADKENVTALHDEHDMLDAIQDAWVTVFSLLQRYWIRQSKRFPHYHASSSTHSRCRSASRRGKSTSNSISVTPLPLKLDMYEDEKLYVKDANNKESSSSPVGPFTHRTLYEWSHAISDAHSSGQRSIKKVMEAQGQSNAPAAAALPVAMHMEQAEGYLSLPALHVKHGRHASQPLQRCPQPDHHNANYGASHRPTHSPHVIQREARKTYPASNSSRETPTKGGVVHRPYPQAHNHVHDYAADLPTFRYISRQWNQFKTSPFPLSLPHSGQSGAAGGEAASSSNSSLTGCVAGGVEPLSYGDNSNECSLDCPAPPATPACTPESDLRCILDTPISSKMIQNLQFQTSVFLSPNTTKKRIQSIALTTNNANDNHKNKNNSNMDRKSQQISLEINNSIPTTNTATQSGTPIVTNTLPAPLSQSPVASKSTRRKRIPIAALPLSLQMTPRRPQTEVQSPVQQRTGARQSHSAEHSTISTDIDEETEKRRMENLIPTLSMLIRSAAPTSPKSLLSTSSDPNPLPLPSFSPLLAPATNNSPDLDPYQQYAVAHTSRQMHNRHPLHAVGRRLGEQLSPIVNLNGRSEFLSPTHLGYSSIHQHNIPAINI